MHSELATHFCETQPGRTFVNYTSFDQFSVEEFGCFWGSFLSWSKIVCGGQIDPVCVGNSSEEARFFPNLKLKDAQIYRPSSDNGLLCCCPA